MEQLNGQEEQAVREVEVIMCELPNDIVTSFIKKNHN